MDIKARSQSHDLKGMATHTCTVVNHWLSLMLYLHHSIHVYCTFIVDWSVIREVFPLSLIVLGASSFPLSLFECLQYRLPTEF